jgi:Domain of unknown function (DUF4262)
MTRHSTDIGLSDHEKSVLQRLEERGWFVNKIMANESAPQFAYSLGLYERWQQPELILAALDLDMMHRLINDAGELIRRGARFNDGETSNDLLEGLPVAFRNVDAEWCRKLMTWTSWYYGGSDFPALQIVWPDGEGRFPWEPNFDRRIKQMQPDLSISPDATKQPLIR